VDVRLSLRPTLLVAGLLAALAMAMPSSAGAAPVVTPHGVGGLRLGATVGALRQKGLIGGVRKGCPFAPSQRVAPLRGALEGWATFAEGTRLTSFSIDGGAETGRHIGVGSTVGAARAAYPKGEWMPPRKTSPFFIGLLWVNRSSDPKMAFVFDPKSFRVESINVPAPAFCE
jgi:hypothetical protein